MVRRYHAQSQCTDVDLRSAARALAHKEIDEEYIMRQHDEEAIKWGDHVYGAG